MRNDGNPKMTPTAAAAKPDNRINRMILTPGSQVVSL
jgi:hypothetical protein